MDRAIIKPYTVVMHDATEDNDYPIYWTMGKNAERAGKAASIRAARDRHYSDPVGGALNVVAVFAGHRSEAI